MLKRVLPILCVSLLAVQVQAAPLLISKAEEVPVIKETETLAPPPKIDPTSEHTQESIKEIYSEEGYSEAIVKEYYLEEVYGKSASLRPETPPAPPPPPQTIFYPDCNGPASPAGALITKQCSQGKPFDSCTYFLDSGVGMQRNVHHLDC